MSDHRDDTENWLLRDRIAELEAALTRDAKFAHDHVIELESALQRSEAALATVKLKELLAELSDAALDICKRAVGTNPVVRQRCLRAAIAAKTACESELKQPT